MKAGTLVSLSLLVAVLTLGSAGVYRYHLVFLPPFQADEAGHALPAARMAIDLRLHDVATFVRDTQREMIWPFVHAWYVTLFFLALGTTTETARVSSLVAFALAVLLAFALTREVWRSREDEPGDGPPAVLGWISAGLMMATASFWIFACRLMMECLGMAMTLASLLAFAIAQRRGSVSSYAWAGLAVAATCLTKYNYGAPVALALLLSGVPGATRLLDRRRVALVFGMGAPVAAWSVYPWPDKLQAIHDMTLNRDEGLAFLSNLLFYPHTLAVLLGRPLMLLLLAALGSAAIRGRDVRTRPLVLFILIGFVLITLHPNKQDRYMFTLLPVLYVLGETELARLATRLAPATRRSRWILGLWGVLLAALALYRNPAPAIAEEGDAQSGFRPAAGIMDFALRSTGPGRRILVLGSGGMLPHLLLEWELTSRLGLRDPVVRLLDFPGGDSWENHRRGYPTEMTPHYGVALSQALRDGAFDDVVCLRIAPDSVFSPEFLKRWDAWGQNYVTAMAEQPGFSVAAQRDFAEDGVLVRIYRPTTAPPTR
jgi:4-amino-4-deoxy-L-arabinose transferase-like glycosyltransferase